MFRPNKITQRIPVLSQVEVRRNISSLLSTKRNVATAAEDDASENNDWEELYDGVKKENENLQSDIYDLKQEIEALSNKISMWEDEFDKSNLPKLLSGLDGISNYQEAYQISLDFNRDWFVKAMLSQSGKVQFAQALFDALDPHLKGHNLGFIKLIADGDSTTLNSLSPEAP